MGEDGSGEPGGGAADPILALVDLEPGLLQPDLEWRILGIAAARLDLLEAVLDLLAAAGGGVGARAGTRRADLARDVAHPPVGERASRYPRIEEGVQQPADGDGD